MSWKYKIIILYLGFISVILTGVIASTFRGFELVREDYYVAEVHYSERIEAIWNVESLKEKPHILVTAEQLRIQFPEGISPQKGEIHLYRPANAEDDILVPLSLTEQRQLVPLQSLKKGNWMVQLSYQIAEKAYYQELRIER